ncbi:MAG: hypothetical protein ACJ0US_02210 [Arenicellales bacterium]
MGSRHSLTQPGQPFERILLTLAEWGVYGDGDPEGLVSRSQWSRFQAPWSEWRDDLELPGGKVIDVRAHKLSERWVGLYPYRRYRREERHNDF